MKMVIRDFTGTAQELRDQLKVIRHLQKTTAYAVKEGYIAPEDMDQYVQEQKEKLYPSKTNRVEA